MDTLKDWRRPGFPPCIILSVNVATRALSPNAARTEGHLRKVNDAGHANRQF